MLEEIYEEIEKLDNYIPCNKVNSIFSKLCNYCIKNDSLYENIYWDNKILNINKICAKAEFEMEKYYNNNIQNIYDLKEFIYYKNYEDLSELEYINTKFLFKNEFKNILFIWWWPLPLTSIILAIKYNINSDIIDIDEESVNISKNLIEKLWLEDKINIFLGDAKTYKNNKKYDVVYIASLVFLDDNDEILKNIKNIDSKLFLTRTSHWLRQILYKKTDEKIIEKYFKTELIIHPKNDIINSILILTKK